MNTTRIGDIGVAHVITRCMEKNIPVYVPFGDNERADLIILLENKPFKVQVKTVLTDKNGKSEFGLKSTTSRIYNRKSVTRHYTSDEVDYYMLYNIARNEVYMLPFCECQSAFVTIRHEPTKNKQQKNIKMDKDHLF